MYDNTRGGNDTLIGVDNATNTLYGDAYEMHNHARGGSDQLLGHDNSSNFLVGDASSWMDTRRQRHADRRFER